MYNNDIRVVITGIGVVSPIGTGVQALWNNLLAGKSGAGPITLFDASSFATQFACEVSDFEPADWFDKKLKRSTGRFTQLGIAASDLAIKDANLVISSETSSSGDNLPHGHNGEHDSASEPYAYHGDRVGVFVGSGIGGIDVIEKNYQTYIEKGPRKISPFFIPASVVNLAPGQISIRHNCRGPNYAQVSACSSGAHAIGDAYHLIKRQEADVMLAGGTEGAVTPMGVGGFCALKALSKRNDDPLTASRPFDKDRDGFVIGEGAGILVLENYDLAKKRGARIYAELLGFGASSDAHHITMPSRNGEGAARCMSTALKNSKVSPSDIGYINAHGTSTAYNDKFESMAIATCFGDRAKKLPISSTKSMTGHLLGAAGGLETSITALSLYHQKIAPTINLHNPDPECPLDYVPNTARDCAFNVAMSNSFGFGGTNASLVLGKI